VRSLVVNMSYFDEALDTFFMDGTCIVDGCDKPVRGPSSRMEFVCDEHWKKMGDSWLAKEMVKKEKAPGRISVGPERCNDDPTRLNRPLGESNERSGKTRKGVLPGERAVGEAEDEEATPLQEEQGHTPKDAQGTEVGCACGGQCGCCD
jgi:hypothetical protein